MRRPFRVRGGRVTPCPKCGNSTDFVGVAERFVEDCCWCWVECSCGYDPTSTRCDERLEDVMGEVSDRTLPAMLEIWNDVLAKEGKDANAG